MDIAEGLLQLDEKSKGNPPVPGKPGKFYCTGWRGRGTKDDCGAIISSKRGYCKDCYREEERNFTRPEDA